MGELSQHKLDDFGCDVFIETGTGKGTGIKYACKYKFEKLYSIEVIPELWFIAQGKVNDNRIELICGNSVEMLDRILPSINKDKKILFWLDAHFPGVDFGYGLGYGNYVYDKDNMPLEDELKCIQKHRKGCKDSFIIDDLRFYEDGKFELGNIDIGRKKSGIGFIEELYAKTHSIVRDYRHQGFLILCPLK